MKKNLHKKHKIMKLFKLSLFKGADQMPIATKTVEAGSRKELAIQKRFFQLTWATWFKNPRTWMDVKRIR